MFLHCCHMGRYASLWFQSCCMFTPTWGNAAIWLINIFQMGWNHQLVYLYYSLLSMLHFKQHSFVLEANVILKRCLLILQLPVLPFFFYKTCVFVQFFAICYCLVFELAFIELKLFTAAIGKQKNYSKWDTPWKIHMEPQSHAGLVFRWFSSEKLGDL